MELLSIGLYKKRRNAIVHKDKWKKITPYTKDIALKRLDIAK